MIYLFSTIQLLVSTILIVRAIKSKDRSEVWNPLIFWSVYYIYYVIKPCLSEHNFWGLNWDNWAEDFALAGLLSFISVYIGFSFTSNISLFKGLQYKITNYNIGKIGIWLCLIAFVTSIIFKGFHLNPFAQDLISADNVLVGSTNHPTEYISSLSSLFCIGIPLLLLASKNNKKFKYFLLGFIALSLIIFLIDGFRYRILILFIVSICSYYLYPKVRKIHYKIVVPILVILYLGMGIIEMSRSYGRGLNLENLNNIELSSIKASEGDIVAYLSSGVISTYKSDDYIYLEPIITAICMPIPRAIFPDKPEGRYLRDANIRIYGNEHVGAAYLMFVEAYASFGWIGIILQGLFIGWVSKIFWNNYKRNPKSIISVVLLGAFNGFSYVWFSRGYFAQVFVTFMYYVIIPFWIISILTHFISPSNSSR